MARLGASRLMGLKGNDAQNAASLAAALGGLKGPAMKVVQLLANIPDVLPPEYSAEFAKLQASAPPMGWPFVKRRMVAELGPDWQGRFAEFSRESAASASLGQVHKARDHEGRELAAKLQYPDMASAVEADLQQLQILLQVQRRISPEIDAREAIVELGERLREELDYKREASHMRLYGEILADHPQIRVPEVVEDLSTKRLLVMSWLQGRPLWDYETAGQETRNFLSECLFRAWWYPFTHFAVIHGDPHMGNYTVFEEDGEAGGLNLLDYGCVRIFPPSFIQGVIDLYEGLKTDDRERVVHAYRDLGLPESRQRARRHPQHLGALHLRADARGPRPGARPRRRRRRVRPARGVPGQAGAAAEGAGDDPARVRLHGPCRGRPRRRLPAPQVGAQLLPPVQRDDRGLRPRHRGHAAARGAGPGEGAGARFPAPGLTEPCSQPAG